MKEILLVDDEPTTLWLVKDVLERAGLRVQCASNGEEAVQQLRNRPFNLLITDLNMPGVNGLELARKSRELAAEMPVILIFGDIGPEVPELAAASGIRKVLPKPLSPVEILAAAFRLLEYA